MRVSRRDAGFTLVEVLITVVLLGVIAVPLGNAVLGFIRNSDATNDRMSLSHDAQISAAWFAQDAASMGRRDYTAPDPSGTLPYLTSIQVNAAYNAGGLNCGASTLPAALVRFLADSWTVSSGVANRSTDIVAYYLKPVGSVNELRRLKCPGAGGSTSDIVLAHNVRTAVLSCAAGCTAATTPPQRVTLTLTVTRPATDDYQIVLDGQRRQT